jgi:hypothetical protein
MTRFFKQGNAKCPFYCRTRYSDADHYLSGHHFIERLWEECAPSVDANASHHAIDDMPPVFWELYRAHALRHSGITLVRQQRTKEMQRGPDHRAANPTVWIEAVTPSPGVRRDILLFKLAAAPLFPHV